MYSKEPDTIVIKIDITDRGMKIAETGQWSAIFR